MTDQLTDVATLIAQLEAERNELDITIAHLRRRLGIAAGADSGAGMVSNVTRSDSAVGRDTAVIVGRVRPDEFFRMSIADAIMKYLEIMKQPQNPMAIVNGLKAGGVLTNAKNFYANVNTELKRMRGRNLVVNTPSGWGLADWYPQKPKQPEPVKKNGNAKKQKEAHVRPAKAAAGAKPPKTAKSARRASAPASEGAAPAPAGRMTYHEFMGEYMRTKKPKELLGEAWIQYKAENA